MLLHTTRRADQVIDSSFFTSLFLDAIIVGYLITWLVVIAAVVGETITEASNRASEIRKYVWYGRYGIVPSVPMMTDVCVKYNESLSFKFDSIEKKLDIYPNTISCNPRSKHYFEDINESRLMIQDKEIHDHFTGFKKYGHVYPDDVTGVGGINITIFNYTNENCGANVDFLGNGIFVTNKHLEIYDCDINRYKPNFYREPYYFGDRIEYICCNMDILRAAINNNSIAIDNKKMIQQIVGDIDDIDDVNDIDDVINDAFLIMQEFYGVESCLEVKWRGYSAKNNIIFDKQCLPLWTLKDLSKDNICDCYPYERLKKKQIGWFEYLLNIFLMKKHDDEIICNECQASILFDLNYCDKTDILTYSNNKMCYDMLTGNMNKYCRGIKENVTYPMYYKKTMNQNFVPIYHNIEHPNLYEWDEMDIMVDEIAKAVCILIGVCAPFLCIVLCLHEKNTRRNRIQHQEVAQKKSK